MSAVWVSVSVAIIATIVATVLGTITAIGLSKCRKFLKEWILNINNIPIMNPDIVTAIGLMILFTSLKIEKGYITMLLAHICFCTPYVITSVYPKVRELDVNVANAALDLGATPFQALIKVIVPMLKPGIYAGMLLAFTMSIDDFVISYFVSGNGVENISMIVYNATKRINPTINALSTIVILVIVVAVFIINIAPRVQKQQWFIKLKNSISPKVKKIFTIASSGLLCVLIVLSVILSNTKENTLKVYNAGEYIDNSLIEQFEQENNCKVIYETFDSNESMYTKIMSGERYDIRIANGYISFNQKHYKFLGEYVTFEYPSDEVYLHSFITYLDTATVYRLDWIYSDLVEAEKICEINNIGNLEFVECDWSSDNFATHEIVTEFGSLYVYDSDVFCYDGMYYKITNENFSFYEMFK